MVDLTGKESSLIITKTTTTATTTAANDRTGQDTRGSQAVECMNAGAYLRFPP